MLKFNNKRDVDRHVAQMTKGLDEKERSTRGYAISKSYAKVSEYEIACDWLQRYLDIKTEDAAAHKFMGEIYEHLKKPELAITSYQRAYNLNSKQNDLIKHICRLFLINDSWTSSPGKAKYWCELADTENVRDDNVLSLRLKMINKGKKNGEKPVEDMILKEIAGRPQDVGMRIRLVQFLLEEKRFTEALKYCFDLEMKFMERFLLSVDWYNTVSSVLAQQTATDSWNYWCLLLISIDKRIFLNLKKDLSLHAIKQNNIKDVTNLIFEFDQVLKMATDTLLVLAPMKELAEEFINHFRGQMALNIAALLFQKQKVASNDKWRETTKKCLPFLLFAFQSSTVNTDAFWLKNSNETLRNLFTYLKKEGSFRCAQAGRTILACKSTANGEMEFNTKSDKSWTSIEDIFNQVRETCSDSNWRKSTYRQLFPNADQQNKISSSYFVQNSYFQEPKFEIISFNDLDNYEVTAQHLYTSSLEHHVYLGLGRKDLHTYKSYTFSGLNLSTSNLINCNPETINRIDVDSFLYCAIIQAKRRLDAEKDCYESFSNKPYDKPLILPAANMVENLCTEEQNDWWLSAFKIYKNITGENLAQVKAILQFGIEAVRGIDTPKVDVIILLRLGDILLARANTIERVEKRNFEIRAEYVYKMAMRMLKSRDTDNLRRIFKFTTSNFDVDREITQLSGNAIGHLSSVYFKREEYKEFIEDFAGVQNPWAHYFVSEAYKKLDESGKTPKKSKKLYVEKARENLIETLALLDENETLDKNFPLRTKVEKELKKMQYNLSSSFNDDHDFHNSSQNGHTDDEVYHNASATSFRRDTSNTANYNEKFNEVESCLKKLSELCSSTKDEVLKARKDIAELKDELLNVRGDVADINVNVFKAIEDLSWNVSYLLNIGPNAAAAMPTARFSQVPPNSVQAQLNQMYNTAYPMSAYPMQYPPPMMQRPPPAVGQPTTHLQYDPVGQNLMMNPQAVSLALQANAQSKSSLMEALSTPNLLNTWNNTYNQPAPVTPPTVQPQAPVPAMAPIQNKPVEKTPPVNVVITNSDPLPAQNSFVSQPTLSVTIPPQHIKHAPQPMFQQQPLSSVSSSLPAKPQYENITPPRNDGNEYLEEPADYDPRPDFKPIIALPDEIEVKTGEENEDVTFSERCKLFRNVDSEWKERGIGNIKILKNQQSGTYRIVMRREQIHKLCANHALTPELKLKPTAKENSLIWGAEDFSDGQMHLEKFLVRFKTGEQANKFKEAFESAQRAPVKEKKTNSVKTKEAAKQKSAAPVFESPAATSTTVSFGGLTGSLTPSPSLFSSSTDKTQADKPKATAPSPFANFAFGQGSANKSFSELYSVACDSPKDSTAPKKEAKSSIAPSADAPKFSFVTPAAAFVAPSAPVVASKGFGDQFKPKAGSWSCEACYTSNTADSLYCAACEAPKDSSVPKKEAKSILAPSADAPKFSFGMPAAFAVAPAAPVVASKGFGDQFKPKAGSWSCEACYTSNTADSLYCAACEAPKDSSVPKKEAKSILAPSADAPKFSFGMPATSGFSFGVQTAPPATVPPTSGFTFGSTVSSAPVGFGFSSLASADKPKEVAADSTSGSGFSFDTSKSFSFGMNTSLVAEKTPVPEVPLSSDKFNFVYKPKSPSKKSPGKSRNDSVNSEGGEDEDAYQEEENQTYFTPVIPLPDKIEVKTGEEDEEVLYSHRAKLFRFTDKEWKERGLGDIKILKNRVTGKLRVVMRREQIFKICLNFFLTDDVELKRKQDNSRTFSAIDYSEGLLEPTSFAVRFKSAEIAEEFEKAWLDAIAGTRNGEQTNEGDEHSKLIAKFKLPPNFYDYINAADCPGCIGCNSDAYVFPTIKNAEADESISLEPPALKQRPKPRRQSVDKHVSFKLADTIGRESLMQLQGTGNVQEKASVFGGGIKKSEGSTNIFAAYNSENPAAPTTIKDFAASSSSIFSTSHNTTPAVSSTADVTFGKPAEPFTGGLFGSKTTFSFGSGGDSIFNGTKENGDASKTTFGAAFGSTPAFGSGSIFGSLSKPSESTTPTSDNIFGSALKSTLSFSEAAKSLDTSNSGVPDFIQNSNDSGGFAALAANATPEKPWSSTNTAPPGGFYGLTVKDDFFSKNLSKQNNSEDQNDQQEVTDENYDPHYEPIISLPDEISVSTGEEDEEKLFAERAKLYRYDSNTKEWKERGVGELKILHHPQHGTHRLLLRREQIFKLVLNQLITPDLHMTPMNNSPKAFSWLGLNCAEDMAGVPEQLAVRFKNEDLAAAFKKKFDESCEMMAARDQLNPEND